jgi:hypothetical protein
MKSRVRYRFRAASKIVKTTSGSNLTPILHIPLKVRREVRLITLRTMVKQ